MDIHLAAKGLNVERFLRTLSHSCQYNAGKERLFSAAELGMPPKIDIEDQLRWNQRYQESPSSWMEPDTFLTSAYQEFLADARPGSALDLAGGAGRNAIWLAERGWRVKLIDISDVALNLAREKFASLQQDSSSQPGAPPPQNAEQRRAPGTPAAAVQFGALEAEVVDLKSVNDLGTEQYDLILTFYFLQRPLFPAIARALKPGGTLIYRTYTIDRMKVPGGPSDPKYLLQPNELLHVFPGLRVLHYHEMVAGKAAAELIVRK
jgi:SAM-dependent methyltransferase